MNVGITGDIARVDWAERWREIVNRRTVSGEGGHPGEHRRSDYWDRRAPSYARITRQRHDEFLRVVEPYVSPRKTLIDAGAGAGRHAVPLAELMEWVTAVEPSEGMRAQIPHRDNMTVVASTWQDAEVAPADIVICCHVLYGIEEAVPFIAKLQASARERVFIMLRQGPVPHPATELRRRMLGTPDLPVPQFSDLFMLLVQMGIAPEVTFVRYPIINHYTNMDEALADSQMLFGAGWDEARARNLLDEMATRDGDQIVIDSGIALSGIAHWQPAT
ncbi:MAG: class I SAM-dependent methyltransferase [Chloroflexi bacterium]|nr:MAG: class I SAM-dependent methyltransferase [Chloroflexota bacterium]